MPGVEARIQSENRAPGVPQQRRRFQLKVLPHLVEIVDVGRERDVLGVNLIRRSPTSPLIVVDEPERIRQSIQVGQEIAVVEIGSAVEDDEGWPRPRSRA